MAARLPALRRFAKRAEVRHCPLARVARAPARRPLARHPSRLCVRLRVRPRPARARVSCSETRRRARRRYRRIGSTSLGARERKVRRYPGLKEEYYLAGFEPDRSVLDAARPRRAARSRRRAHAARRLALPPTRESALRRRARSGSARIRPCRPSCFRARPSNARRSRSSDLPSLVVPEHAVDAQSLVAHADLVVSAGGTMNREAVALGVPVYTTFAGRLGAVDEMLIAEGRLGVLDLGGRIAGTQARSRRSNASIATLRCCSTSCSPPCDALSLGGTRTICLGPRAQRLLGRGE